MDYTIDHVCVSGVSEDYSLQAYKIQYNTIWIQWHGLTR